MNGHEKSDTAIVATKPANKVALAAAEPVERRAGTERNAGQHGMCRTQSRESMSLALDRIREAAKARKRERFTALAHHLTPDLLTWAFHRLAKDAAAGVDGVTWDGYAADLERRITDLHGRVHRGAYQAQPSRRRYIPKADGRRRPLGVAALEDKIVQRAAVEVLGAIYEEDFLGFSYGFRPGRSQHDALDALAFCITQHKVSWILDADISGFFDAVSHDHLDRFLKHRIGDSRMLRLLGKWLKAGVVEDGQTMATERGTPQGAVISPLLSNIYLHYVFDLWANQWRHRHARGEVFIVRYADDIVVGFQLKSDAERFRVDMGKRLEQFDLMLHPDKTRLIEFGRFAAKSRRARGEGKPETFDFLGFTHIAGTSRTGYFQLQRKSRADRMRAKLKEIKESLKHRWHLSAAEQGQWLGQVVAGYLAYHAVPTNGRSLQAFLHLVKVIWKRALHRRSQKDRTTWVRMDRLADTWLPKLRILHPWPVDRFLVKHSR